MLNKEVKDMKLGKLSFSELVDKMGEGGGFSAKNLSTAVNILEEMNKDECIKILSFPACIISTGMRGVISQMIEKGLVVSGLSPDNKLVEMIELQNHSWFLGCQFHPELKSRATKAHPLFREFVAAAVEFSKKK